MDLIRTFWEQVYFKDLVDILIVTFLIYQLVIIVHRTRAIQMLLGVGALVVLFWVGISYQLHSVNWLLQHFFNSFFIIVIILFQEQIRTGLASFGTGRKFFGGFAPEVVDLEIDEIVEVCSALGQKRIGGIVVLEKANTLDNYMLTGTRLNSKIHSDIIFAIFESSCSLHDGAIIISRGLIAAAGCFLPLSKNMELEKNLGSRHRASLGISEMTDAIVVTVSEETGRISISLLGVLYPIRDESHLRSCLKGLSGNYRLNKELLSLLQG